jgi:hypothetical protein
MYSLNFGSIGGGGVSFLSEQEKREIDSRQIAKQ